MLAVVGSTVLGALNERRTWVPLQVAFMLVVAAGAQPAAATDVCGSVCGATWNVAGSPYVLTCNVSVSASCTLTIDAGVEVLSQTGFELEVYGTLDVNGTVGSPVIFGSDASTPAALDWTGLAFRGSAIGHLDHASVAHADRGIDAAGSATLSLDGVTTEQNRYGLYVFGSGPPTVNVTNSTFTDNTLYGVYLRGNPNPNVTITQSSLHGNLSGKDLYTYAYASSSTFVQLARDNWWGSTDPAVIAQRIYDHRNSGSSPRVDWCHYLDAPPPVGVWTEDVHCPDVVVCDSSATWGLVDKPYQIVTDLWVCPGRTLTLGPGVEVRIAKTAPQPDFLIEGTLDVNGIEAAPTLIRSDHDTPQALDWIGLTFRGSSVGYLDHLVVNHADRGIDAGASSTLHLTDVTAEQNRYGLYVHGAGPPTVNVSESTFTDNTLYGVYLRGAPNPNVTITQSSLFGNLSGKDLYTYAYADSGTFVQLARDNWWGSADPAVIAQRIYDHRNSGSSPRVDWCHYLDAPPPAGVWTEDVHCPDVVVCDSSATWDLTDKPYQILTDVWVCPDKTLTLGPGVEVRIAKTAPQPDFVIEGTLDVNGTLASPTLIRSDHDTPQALDWIGLTFRGSSVGYLDHLVVHHADRGIDAGASSTLHLTNVTAEQNRYGLYVHGAGPPTVNVSESTFTDNTLYGVYLRGAPNPNVTLTRSSLFGNLSGKDLYTYAYADSGTFVQLARDNWWGSSDPAVIAQRIYDQRNSGSSPRVDWCHYLDAPPPGGILAEDVHCPEVIVCDSSVTWDLTDKPYQILTDVRVCAGQTLTLGPGVEARIAKTVPQPDFLIEGTLDVNGTLASPTLIRSDHDTPQALDWIGLTFRGSSVGYLDHLVVNHADRGIDAGASSTLHLTNVTAAQNRYGLYVHGAGPPTVNVSESTFIDNTLYGVYLRGNPNPNVTITQSSLHGNLSGKDLYTYAYASSSTFVQLARDNWWGSADPAVIAQHIYDHRNSGSSPRVDWCHYLDAPPPAGILAEDVHCPEVVVCGSPVTWDLTDKPYQILTDVWVCPGQTLTVESGVEVRMAKTAPQPDFLIEGTLDINGIEEEPVRILSDHDTPQALDWIGLTFRGEAEGYLDHLEVTHADRGIDAGASSTLHLTNVTAEQNRYGLYVHGAGPPTVNVSESTFTDNTLYGIYLRGSPNPDVTLTQSSLYGNLGGKDLYTYAYANSGSFVQTAQDNWWGSDDAAQIGQRIYEHRNSGSSPRVDWCHYLDAPPPDGVQAENVHCPELVACDSPVTWDLTDKPYHVVTDVWVCPGQTLTLEPGVEALMAKTTPQPDFLIEGTLDVNGIEGSPVRILSDQDIPQALDWIGLAFRGSAEGYLDHLEVAHADRGIDAAGSATLFLDGVKSRNNRYGLYVHGAGPPTVSVAGSSLTDNTLYGAYVRGNPNPDVTITRSSLLGNAGGKDIYSYAYASPATSIVWATDNWWGTTDPVAIEARIYDNTNSGSSPHVYFRAFGDDCDYAIGRDLDRDGLPDFQDNCPGQSNPGQSDGDGDGMGDPCDPEPGVAPLDECDGFEDVLDGYVDADGDGWGDPCDHHPLRDDSYPGAPELCDGRDNDGDVWLAFAEQADDDGDLGLACGDCDDYEPLSNVCMCEQCDNLLDDDCDLASDGADSECQAQPICVALGPGAEPELTMHKGECGGATVSGPFDVIRGDLTQLQFDVGHVDLGSVACVGSGLDWDRVTDHLLEPIARCMTVPSRFFLGKYTTDSDYGSASGGEWRDVMDPDPACLP